MTDWNWYRVLQTLESIAALFIVVGLLTAAVGWGQYRASQATADWPAADGSVLTSEVVQVERRGRSLTYIDAVRIAYSYTVDGEIFVKDRISLDGAAVRADSDAGRSLLAEYPEGKLVPVYYNPADPSQSVLLRGTQTWALRSGSALAVLGVAVLGLRWLWRKKPYITLEGEPPDGEGDSSAGQ